MVIRKIAHRLFYSTREQNPSFLGCELSTEEGGVDHVHLGVHLRRHALLCDFQTSLSYTPLEQQCGGHVRSGQVRLEVKGHRIWVRSGWVPRSEFFALYIHTYIQTFIYSTYTKKPLYIDEILISIYKKMVENKVCWRKKTDLQYTGVHRDAAIHNTENISSARKNMRENNTATSLHPISCQDSAQLDGMSQKGQQVRGRIDANTSKALMNLCGPGMLVFAPCLCIDATSQVDE